MNYPYIIFLRWEKYKDIDEWFETHKRKLDCTVTITSDIKDVIKLFNPNYQLLVTYGEVEYNQVLEYLPERMRSRWIHYQDLPDVNKFNRSVNYCFVDNAIQNREKTRPIFSIFTSCFNSYEKIHRAYDSLKEQTLNDWEWVVLDDSPDDKHFEFLRELSINDERIRLYRRDRNNGNIGNVKNETIGLCRGKYVLELDHDDEIDKDTLLQAVTVFEKYPEVGFVYMDFINIYEDGKNFRYGDFICKGYGGYYMQRYKGKWRYVYSTPNINNVTMSHLVCCPNHPRIWRRSTLLEIGNYSEFLPICDDFEIILRSSVSTKIAKIAKLAYVQYMNHGSNNFSLIRNKEINRIGPNYIQPMFYKKYKVNEVMKEKGGHEDEKYITHASQTWKRDESYQNKFCNLLLNLDYDRQYCLIGADLLINPKIMDLYDDPRNDIVVFDNRFPNKTLCKYIDLKGYDQVKCYYMHDCDMVRFKNYFEIIYRSCEETKVIISTTFRSHENIYSKQSDIINALSKSDGNYLEIGIEYGTTYNKVNIKNKYGVDPDPEYKNGITILKSDDFFQNNDVMFDSIFIDGMHQSDYVLRDIINSLKYINDGGLIFIDDIVPDNEEEQKKIPTHHRIVNGILKYKPGHPWTGDVWKTLLYLIKYHSDKFTLKCYLHENTRGVAVISNITKFEIDYEKALSIIDEYNYIHDYEHYLDAILPYC